MEWESVLYSYFKPVKPLNLHLQKNKALLMATSAKRKSNVNILL